MAKIDFNKLSLWTLIDLVKANDDSAELRKEIIHVFGGSKRDEFCVYIRHMRFSPVADTPIKAWKYAAEKLYK